MSLWMGYQPWLLSFILLPSYTGADLPLPHCSIHWSLCPVFLATEGWIPAGITALRKADAPEVTASFHMPSGENRPPESGGRCQWRQKVLCLREPRSQMLAERSTRASTNIRGHRRAIIKSFLTCSHASLCTTHSAWLEQHFKAWERWNWTKKKPLGKCIKMRIFWLQSRKYGLQWLKLASDASDKLSGKTLSNGEKRDNKGKAEMNEWNLAFALKKVGDNVQNSKLSSIHKILKNHLKQMIWQLQMQDNT